MKIFLVLMSLLCAAVIMQGKWAAQQSDVPAYHAAPPAPGTALPPILTEKQLAEKGLNQPVQLLAYKAAALRPKVMYQEPCFCHCDRSVGHTSLHSCFEGTHGAECGVCMAESLYSYQMSKKGWSTKMIRDGIIRGDWKNMDLQHPEPVN